MKEFSPVKELSVLYHGQNVGTLKEQDGAIAFRYAANWLANGFSISPFSLPLRPDTFLPKNEDFNGLFGVFAGSLPGSYGAMVRLHYLATRYENPASILPLGLLSLLDEDSLGALAYQPHHAESSIEQPLSLAELKKLTLDFLKSIDEKQLRQLYHLSGSSGGARPKVNQRIAGELWILKFPSPLDREGSAIRENDYLDCAASLGLPVCEHRLFPCPTGEVFGAKRFDRKEGLPIHMISLAQLLETSIEKPFLDYGHLFKVIERFGGGEKEMMDVFSLLVFNVASHNYDDHANNVSFLYEEQAKRYVLAPFYDLTGPECEKEHEMMVNGSGKPTKDDIFALVRQFGLNEKRCEKRYEQISSAVHKALGKYLVF